jgi:hypothetical protein
VNAYAGHTDAVSAVAWRHEDDTLQVCVVVVVVVGECC